MEWQPISTAPKDRRILLYYPDPIFTDHEIMTGKWDADEYAKKPRPHWTNDASWLRTSMARAHQPTHWMPLPEPPTEQAAARGEG